ncbi:MAG: transporter related protein [Francisellaceae bacterium]|nr:transporter related protein [Francisellaceae bacterium]
MNDLCLLDIQNLNINLQQKNYEQPLIKNISFSMGYEKLGIVGSSGSGKTLTMKSLLGLTQSPLRVKALKMNFLNHSLLDRPQSFWKKIRGKLITMVMQDARLALNPIMTIGEQLKETYLLHEKISHQEVKSKILTLLESLSIVNPEQVYHQYVHEISGGMAQRILIGMMTVAQPKLLLVDEPTSALDAKLKHEIIMLFEQIFKAHQMGIIFISHDLELVASFCDTILIMKDGQIMEKLSKNTLHLSTHPYTQSLIKAIPKLPASLCNPY